jgi:hypothetical protein
MPTRNGPSPPAVVVERQLNAELPLVPSALTEKVPGESDRSSTANEPNICARAPPAYSHVIHAWSSVASVAHPGRLVPP